MRKQIAAANWKMNLTYQQGEKLLDDILDAQIELNVQHQQVIFAVPFPYLIMAMSEVADEKGYAIAAQNCSDKKNGAFTGEVSAEMLQSIGVSYCVLGHSERREYFLENNRLLAAKLDMCLQYDITPIFCCGESLKIREENNQNHFVQQQMEESLFHLSPDQIKKIVIARKHKAFQPDTIAHKQFMASHIEKVRFLSKKYSFLNLQEELTYFSGKGN